MSESNTVQLIEEFRNCLSYDRLEELADELAETPSDLATEALIERLGSERVQSDPDVESAVCDALVKHGVMQQLGNLRYRFLDTMPAQARNALAKHRQTVPSKKYGTVPT